MPSSEAAPGGLSGAALLAAVGARNARPLIRDRLVSLGLIEGQGNRLRYETEVDEITVENGRAYVADNLGGLALIK